MYKIWKYFEKGQVIVCDYCMQKTARIGPVCHTDKGKFYFGLSVTWNQRKTCLIQLSKEVGEICVHSCWRKGNFILIYEFKYGQARNIWPSPLSLSRYNPFKDVKSNWADNPGHNYLALHSYSLLV